MAQSVVLSVLQAASASARVAGGVQLRVGARSFCNVQGLEQRRCEARICTQRTIYTPLYLSLECCEPQRLCLPLLRCPLVLVQALKPRGGRQRPLTRHCGDVVFIVSGAAAGSVVT